jgi:tetratricopeptide (TPR) repeat protein
MKKSRVLFEAGIAVMLAVLAVCVSQAQEAGGSDEAKMQKARECFLAGKELLAKGDFAAANEAFKNAQKFLEGLPSGTAVIAEENTLLSAGNSAPSYIKKAQEADSKGDFKQAADNYRKAAEYSPLSADIHYNAGVEFLKLNQFTEAAKAFQYAAELNPRDKDAYYNLGVLFDEQLNDKDKALEYYLRYLSLAPYGNDSESVKAAVSLIRGQSGKK